MQPAALRMGRCLVMPTAMGLMPVQEPSSFPSVFLSSLQKRLEELIQQKNVDANFELAMEHNPEAFASVCML